MRSYLALQHVKHKPDTVDYGAIWIDPHESVGNSDHMEGSSLGVWKEDVRHPDVVHGTGRDDHRLVFDGVGHAGVGPPLPHVDVHGVVLQQLACCKTTIDQPIIKAKHQ